MPAASIDTFFACSLMVIVVLSAMAGTSKILTSYMSNTDIGEVHDRYEEISNYILMNPGKPVDWGKDSGSTPQTFGLARTGSLQAYELDVDKVSRLNSDNIQPLDYSTLYTCLGIEDISFGIEVKPIFEVSLNLTGFYQTSNETTYEFEVLTRKDGAPIQALVRYYSVAEEHFSATPILTCRGETHQNITIPNSVNGPALLIAFARSVTNHNISSASSYSFAHGSSSPEPTSTFLRLSPLGYRLNASFTSNDVNLSRAYGLSFDYSSLLESTISNNESVEYEIPLFLDPSPTVLVVTGWNSTMFFAGSVMYPQIPLQTGVEPTSASSLTDFCTYTYTVRIGSALYQCRIWIGEPKE